MKRYSRATVVIACLLGLSAQAAPEPDAEADFCARLATELGVKKTKSINGHTFWKANALNFGQRFLFGGSTSISLAAVPVDPVSVEEYELVAEMCQLKEGGGAACRLTGPVNFRFGWKGSKSLTPILEGERAIVVVKGSKARCQSGVTELSE